VYWLIGARDGWVLALQLLVGATTPVWLFLGGKRLFGERIAFWAGLFTAVYGPLAYYECMVMKTFLLPWLVAIALYAGLRYREGLGSGWLGLAGVAIGLMCLVQESHALLGLPLALWVWDVGREAGCSRLRTVANVAWLTLAVVMPVVPCAIRNYMVCGEPVLVTVGGGEVFYIAHGPDAEAVYSPPPFVTADASQEHRDFVAEAERRTGRRLTRQQSSRYWFREAWRYAVAHPWRELVLTVQKANVLFKDFEVPDSASFAETRRLVPLLYVMPTFGWFAWLGFLGVLVCLKSVRRFQLPLGMAAVLVLSVLLTYNFGRFRIALVPLWMLLAAQGLAWIGSAWRRRAEPLTALALVGAVLFVALATLWSFVPPARADYRISLVLRDALRASADGDLLQAEAKFREALQFGHESGDEAAIRNNLGVVLARQGRLEEAAEQFCEAVRLNPEYHDAQQNLLQARAALRAAGKGTKDTAPPPVPGQGAS
jgi:tetratricopeptide (TPR) repeat protein